MTERTPHISLLELFPPGIIVPYSNSVPPPGYLACDGRSYSITQYSLLFGVIGYTFGGSGSFFSVPDTRDQFIRGASVSRAVGTIEESRIKIHDHKFNFPETGLLNDNFELIGFKSEQQDGDLVNVPQTTSFIFGLGQNNKDFGDEMRPKNIRFLFIIKY